MAAMIKNSSFTEAFLISLFTIQYFVCKILHKINSNIYVQYN